MGIDFSGNGLRISEEQGASEELVGREDTNYIYFEWKGKG